MNKPIFFRYKPINNGKQIGNSRNTSTIKGIAIHMTDNFSVGADAMAHYRYLQKAERPGSAHYYISATKSMIEIVQPIGDSKVAWHVGDKWGYKNNPNRRKDLNNTNTIGIEMCVNKDGDFNSVRFATIELVKNLMVKYNIKPNNVVRHFDITGKKCPSQWNNNDWNEFKKEIVQPMKVKIDISRDAVKGEYMINNIINNITKPVDIKLMIDNKNIELKDKLINKNGRVYVKVKNNEFYPIREILEGLGYRVSWLQEEKTVMATINKDKTKEYKSIDIIIKPHDEVIPGIIKNGVTYISTPDGEIPLRIVAETLGFEVTYINEETPRVELQIKR